MENKPVISVVVPIYMIDRYVGLCIESILNQTYRELEIILVDDGGDDRCPELCDLYAKKDRRIKVIHKPNGGLVSARKAGIRAAKGEYVAYVDGDDRIGPGFIETLYNAAQTSGADMVCAGFTRDLFDRSVTFTDTIAAGIYEGEDLQGLWKRMISDPPFYRPGISTYVWNKLFRREIVKDVQLAVDERISIGEDAAVTYPALLKCRKIAVTDNVAYHYRQREDSMLKQQAEYKAEAQKLVWLYEYLEKWSKSTPAELNIRDQVIDYVLSLAFIRSGGQVPGNEFGIFGRPYQGKRVVIYSAGTFGQQLVKRIRETKHCDVVAWIDDDYWEYRRCCMDVDPVESVTRSDYDHILIATVNERVAANIIDRLSDLGVGREKILTVELSHNKEETLKRFLDFIPKGADN